MIKVVIIGGGFAGLHLAQKLNKSHYSVTLIDKQNHHQFQPLFYQVASSAIEPSNISFPYRKIFQKSKNFDYILGEVIQINSNKNTIETSVGEIAYNQLIIATGCDTNYFGNEKLKQYSLPMKTTQEAIKIRNSILLNFELYRFYSDDEKEAALNIVVVGAGPTGVELSGAFAEMKKKVLPLDYPNIDFSKLKIILIEGSPNTLNNFSEISKISSLKYLQELGVEVKTSVVLSDYDGKTVTLNNGEKIKSKNVIWAAGVSGNIIEGLKSENIIRNRYIVDRFNKIEGYTNIYAIGDIACMKTPKYPNGHPQVANVAINQGANLAKNLNNSIKNKTLKEYEYYDMGSMATIGRHKAVVELPFMKFQGRMAWYVWMFLHLMLILSVRNKFNIFLNWAWNYVAHDSSLRLIIKTK
jgi:NADH dehydrogenase